MGCRKRITILTHQPFKECHTSSLDGRPLEAGGPCCSGVLCERRSNLVLAAGFLSLHTVEQDSNHFSLHTICCFDILRDLDCLVLLLLVTSAPNLCGSSPPCLNSDSGIRNKSTAIAHASQFAQLACALVLGTSKFIFICKGV